MNTLDTNPILNPLKAGSENCLPVGTRLTDFEITGIIGEGGFGVVYLAFDHSLQRTVAIKEYMPGALAGRGEDKSVVLRSQRHQETFESGLKGFINEARLLAQFDHPALIKVYRFWEQNNTGYMVMRYYEGKTLKDVIKSDPTLVTEQWLKSILKPILEALDSLYKVQILHRDISPDNIMIQKNGEAVLLDFGAARKVIGDMTQALTVILKPGYAPIEQYADDMSMKQGPWTDIYALSAVVYSAIVKKPPPTSVARMIKDPIEPLQSKVHGGFSNEFLSAIDHGLSVKPEDRPQSIEEFRNLLQLESPASIQTEALSVSAASILDNNKLIENFSESVEPDLSRDNVHFLPLRRENKKALIKSSWVLLIVGILLAVGFCGYQMFGHKPEQTVVARPDSSSSDIESNSISTPELATDIPPSREVAVQPHPATHEEIMDEETVSWESLRNGNNTTPEELIKFIQKYPSGKYTESARAKLFELKERNSANTDKTKLTGTTITDATKPAESLQNDSKQYDIAVARTIRLTIKPWGNVWIDGVSMGVSPPLKKLALTDGKHQIRIVNPNFPDYVAEIEINKKFDSIDYSFPITK